MEEGRFRCQAAASCSCPSGESPDVLINICGIGGKKLSGFQPAPFDLFHKNRKAVSTLFQPCWREKEVTCACCQPGTCMSTVHLLILVSYATTSTSKYGIMTLPDATPIFNLYTLVYLLAHLYIILAIVFSY